MQILRSVLFLLLTVFLNSYLTVHTLTSHASLFAPEAHSTSCSHHHHEGADDDNEHNEDCDICEVDLQVLYPAPSFVFVSRPAGRMQALSTYKESANHASALRLPDLRGPPAVS